MSSRRCCGTKSRCCVEVGVVLGWIGLIVRCRRVGAAVTGVAARAPVGVPGHRAAVASAPGRQEVDLPEPDWATAGR